MGSDICMNSIIKELWYGNVRPREDCRPQTEEYTNLLEYMLRHKAELYNTFNHSQFEVFEKLESCTTEYVSLSEEALFAYAYRLGTRTAMEALLERFNVE